jgi:hypothetical protein
LLWVSYSKYSWLVGLERLELSTPPLSRVCSNQLSYRPAIVIQIAPSARASLGKASALPDLKYFDSDESLDRESGRLIQEPKFLNRSSNVVTEVSMFVSDLGL